MSSSAGKGALEALIKRTEEPEFVELMARQAEVLPDKVTYRDCALGLRTNLRYLERFTPEVLAGGLKILEVGPGVGCWMLLAREMGNTVVGEDLESGAMVDSYKPIIEHWGLEVHHFGFHRYLTRDPAAFPYPEGEFDLIHFRGSIGGVLREAGLENLVETIDAMVELWLKHLKPGGMVYIAHNVGEVADAFAAELPKCIGPLDIHLNTGQEAKLQRP